MKYYMATFTCLRVFLLFLAFCLSKDFQVSSAIASELEVQDVETITILPVVFPSGQTDKDRSQNFDSYYGKLDEYIYKALLRKLAIKGYVLDKPRGWNKPSEWTVEQINHLSPQELIDLAPKSADCVVYLFLEELSSNHYVVASSANAKVSARIIHRDGPSVLWDKSEQGKFGENIIFSVMWVTPDKHAAVEKAFGRLFDDLPEKQY